MYWLPGSPGRLYSEQPCRGAKVVFACDGSGVDSGGTAAETAVVALSSACSNLQRRHLLQTPRRQWARRYFVHDRKTSRLSQWEFESPLCFLLWSKDSGCAGYFRRVSHDGLCETRREPILLSTARSRPGEAFMHLKEVSVHDCA